MSEITNLLYNNHMKRLSYLITIITIAFTFGVIILTQTHAYSPFSRDSLEFDETLSNQLTTEYAYPEKILVTQIDTDAVAITAETEGWIDHLYYYMITRQGFADLPYNYLLDRQGNIYEGRKGHEGVVPELAELEGAFLIGYLSNSSDMPLPAKQALQEFIEEMSYKYGISAENIMAVDLSIASQEAENKLSKLNYEVSDSRLSLTINQVVASAELSEESNLVYTVEMAEIEQDKTTQIGGKIPVKFNVTNVGETPWYTTNDFIYVTTANGEDSKFAVNGVWDGFDTPTHIEGQTVFPDESVEITFELQAMIEPGGYSEEFKLTRLNGTLQGDTEFIVKFNVEKGDARLLRIDETPTGNLNVRETPGLNGVVMGQIDVGKTVLIVESTAGWYKIQFTEEKQGWVSATYATEL